MTYLGNTITVTTPSELIGSEVMTLEKDPVWRFDLCGRCVGHLRVVLLVMRSAVFCSLTFADIMIVAIRAVLCSEPQLLPAFVEQRLQARSQYW